MIAIDKFIHKLFELGLPPIDKFFSMVRHWSCKSIMVESKSGSYISNELYIQNHSYFIEFKS